MLIFHKHVNFIIRCPLARDHIRLHLNNAKRRGKTRHFDPYFSYLVEKIKPENMLI
jgi:hypothetical protein